MKVLGVFCNNGASASLLLRIMIAAMDPIRTTSDALFPSDYLTTFVLVNSQTNEDIAVLQDGAIVSYAHVGRYLNIRAESAFGGDDRESIGSVRFDFQDDPDYRIENTYPYALAGDSGGDYVRLTGLTGGLQTLCATPYTEANGEGEAGSTLCIDFTIQSQALFEITNFVLYNADTDEELFPIMNGASYFFDVDLPTKNLNVCVSYTGLLESVSFAVSGLSPNPINIESTEPYCLGGDIDRTGDILAFDPFLNGGTFHISAQGYTGESSSGFTLPKSTIRFSLLGGDDTMPTPSPTPADKKCFASNSELRLAAQQYHDGQGTPDLEVSQVYGFPIGTWCVKDVTDFSYVFRDLKNFNEDISAWDVSSATSLHLMFGGAESFNQPLNAWNISQVESIRAMFISATSFNQPLDDWDVSRVTDMGSLFAGADAFNQPLNDWDVSQVTDLTTMFASMDSFNQPLDKWYFPLVRDTSFMFSGAISFNQPLNDWDVSRVTRMSGMFRRAISFNQPLDQWKVLRVRFFDFMFSKATSFNQPLNSWDTSRGDAFEYMFRDAVSFNQPLDNWIFSRLRTIAAMFEGAINFRQDLCPWQETFRLRLSGWNSGMFTNTSCPTEEDPVYTFPVVNGPFCFECI